MTAEQKKDLVRRYYQEVWSKGNLDFVDQVFTDDYVNCDPATPGGRVEGAPAFKEIAQQTLQYLSAPPDAPGQAVTASAP